MDDLEKLSEAEQYHLQAQFVLNELQANLQVYKSNSMLSGANPANVDLGLQYIDRCLEYFPENVAYLNTKALLIGEGKGDRAQAVELLEKAHAINPRDITVKHNLDGFKSSSSCFIATAAYGSAMSPMVIDLRVWRDRSLKTRSLGRWLVRTYYRVSPPIAKIVSRSVTLRLLVRSLIRIVHPLLNVRTVIN